MVNKEVKHEEGFLKISGIKIFYERFGKGNRHRLIALHGGPGASHDYLLSLSDLASLDFDIVFYDQFGCGRSDYPKNESDYSLEYAVEEVEGVRRAIFGNQKIHLFGNSWGGMLSLAYAIKYQENLITLISSSGLSNVPETVKEMHRLISQLPAKYKNAIEEHERKGDFDNPEYVEASEYFMKQHLLRIEEYPEDVVRSLQMMNDRGTYLKMNGPSEFTINGIIKNINFDSDLKRITVPTLITCGKYDEVTTKIAESIHGEIKGSMFKMFNESSHMAFREERELYIGHISDFMKSHDR